MNFQDHWEKYWRKAVLDIVKNELAKRNYDESVVWNEGDETFSTQRYDVADDSMMFDELLLALFPPDDRDCRKKDENPNDA